MDTFIRTIMIFMSILITVGIIALVVTWWVSEAPVVLAITMTCLDLAALAEYYLVTIHVWIDIFG